MSKSKPPSPDEVKAKMESIRPDGTSDVPLAPEDVTAVLHLALERLGDVQDETHAAIIRATERLKNETRQTVAVTRALSAPPKAPK